MGVARLCSWAQLVSYVVSLHRNGGSHRIRQSQNYKYSRRGRDGTLANVTNERTPRRLLSDVKVRWFHTKYNARGVSAPSAGVSRNDVDTHGTLFLADN